MTAGIDREEILRRFEALLDSALAGEAPPAGVDAEILAAVTGPDPSLAEGQCDSYALWSVVTALTEEIRLQGRAFQDLNRTLAGQAEKVAEELRGVYAEREREVRRDSERRCRREALTALIDLRDRLSRGRESARGREAEVAAASKKPWLARILSGAPGAVSEVLSALIRGYELGVERLDQTLDEWNAAEIRCEGETFDPHRMNAIDSETTAAVPPNTVLEVYRSGYEWNGEVFRAAQVKISRPPESLLETEK
jgi:molecular chaperone GrpE